MTTLRLTLAACAIGAGLALLHAPQTAAQPLGPAGDGLVGGPGAMGGHHGGPRMGGGMMRALRGLDLSEAQRDAVFEIMHGQAPAMRERMKALRKARLELRALAQSADFDAARARARADAVGRAMADLALARAESGSRIYKLLTPEQRARLARMGGRG